MNNLFNRASAVSRRPMLPVVISLIALALILAACGGSAPEPTAAPASTPVAAAPADTATSVPPTATAVPQSATPVPPTDTPVSPTATPIPPTNTPVPSTETPEPTEEPEPTEQPEPTEEPEPTETPLPAPTEDNSALIAQGRSVFEANGCAGCHGEPGGAGIVSPNLGGIATRAGSRVAGLSAEAYIRQSIQDPNAFIVPDCPAGPCPTGVMPPTFGTTLSSEQFNALVAYLLTLN